MHGMHTRAHACCVVRHAGRVSCVCNMSPRVCCGVSCSTQYSLGVKRARCRQVQHSRQPTQQHAACGDGSFIHNAACVRRRTNERTNQSVDFPTTITAAQHRTGWILCATTSRDDDDDADDGDGGATESHHYTWRRCRCRCLSPGSHPSVPVPVLGELVLARLFLRACAHNITMLNNANGSTHTHTKHHYTHTHTRHARPTEIETQATVVRRRTSCSHDIFPERNYLHFRYTATGKRLHNLKGHSTRQWLYTFLLRFAFRKLRWPKVYEVSSAEGADDSLPIADAVDSCQTFYQHDRLTSA